MLISGTTSNFIYANLIRYSFDTTTTTNKSPNAINFSALTQENVNFKIKLDTSACLACLGGHYDKGKKHPEKHSQQEQCDLGEPS